MKEQILYRLLQNTGTPLSGVKLANDFGVSRVMVHKYIESLRREGYEIKAQEGQGYSLYWPEWELNPVKSGALVKGNFGRVLTWKPQVGSTQEELMQLVSEGQAQSGQVLAARSQTSGRGRRGRAWRSDPGGLWFSIYIGTDLPLADIAKLSLVFSLALVGAIKPLCPTVQIKWPNDIVVNRNKLGGLLLNLLGEANDITNLVVGVGVNVNNDPPVLETGQIYQPTSIKEVYRENVSVDELFAAILHSMESLYNSYSKGGWDKIIDDYRRHCCHLGQTITVSQGDQWLTGINTAITDEGNLELQTADKSVILYSGDII